MTVGRTSDAVEALGRSFVRSRLRSGLWQQPARGVVVDHNGPLDANEKAMVALHAAPRRSALAGLASLHLDGLTGFETDLTYLALPNGGRKPQLPGVQTHQSIHLDDADVDPRREPRRTRPGRSVIDAASWCGNDRYARAIVIAAIQQGVTSTRQIREALERRPTQLRRAIVVQSVLDAAGGIQSLPERDFGDVVRRAGLPHPTRQQKIRGKDRRYYLDVWWESFQLGVEVHGIPHLSVRRWDADLVRANEIILRGHRLLSFSSYAIRHESDAVVDQLRRAMRAAA